jgi:Ni/Fe-hydrogenase 1 B-type cytochrome subunit
VLLITGFYIGRPVLAPSGEAAAHFLMGGMRYWHGVFAFIFIAILLLRLYWFWAGKVEAKIRFWQKYFWRDVGTTLKYYAFLSPQHTIHLGHNAMAQISYLTIIWLNGALMIVTGMALRGSATGQGIYALFRWPISLCGETRIRLIHHFMSWLFPIFVLIHLYLAFRQDLLDRDGTMSSIFNGFKYIKENEAEAGQGENSRK